MVADRSGNVRRVCTEPFLATHPLWLSAMESATSLDEIHQNLQSVLDELASEGKMSEHAYLRLCSETKALHGCTVKHDDDVRMSQFCDMVISCPAVACVHTPEIASLLPDAVKAVVEKGEKMNMPEDWWAELAVSYAMGVFDKDTFLNKYNKYDVVLILKQILGASTRLGALILNAIYNGDAERGMPAGIGCLVCDCPGTAIRRSLFSSKFEYDIYCTRLQFRLSRLLAAFPEFIVGILECNSIRTHNLDHEKLRSIARSTAEKHPTAWLNDRFVTVVGERYPLSRKRKKVVLDV